MVLDSKSSFSGCENLSNNIFKLWYPQQLDTYTSYSEFLSFSFWCLPATHGKTRYSLLIVSGAIIEGTL